MRTWDTVAVLAFDQLLPRASQPAITGAVYGRVLDVNNWNKARQGPVCGRTPGLTEGSESVELKDWVRVVRMRWRLVSLVVLVVVVAAAAGSLIQPPTYQARARVLVTEQNAGSTLIGSPLPDQTNQPGFVQTQVELIGSAPLVQKTIDTLGLKTTSDDLLKRVTLSEVGQTNLVTIDVLDGDAQRAARIANALAYGYVAWSRDVKQASIKAAGDELQQRLDAARAQQNKNLSATLADKLESVHMAQQLETGSGIVLPATGAGAVRVAPNVVRNGALGIVVGLVCAFGIVVLAEYFDDTIKDPDEAEVLYDAPVLAHIHAERSDQQAGRRLSVVERPSSPEAEGYRILRNSLHFGGSERGAKVVLVASPESSEGRSNVAANLAASLSQAGKQAMLIVCDFRRPSVGRVFDVKEDRGLSDALAARNPVDWTSSRATSLFQRPKGFKRLWVLAAGMTPDNPSDLLGSPQMGDLIRRLRNSMDWIIMDTPPLLEVADAMAAAQWADGVLVVVRDRASTRDAAKKGRAQLENAGACILGVVVWDD